MYKCERDDQIKDGGRKRIPTASRTICPDWQRGKWWELNEVGGGFYGRPRGEGLAGGANTVGGAIPLP